MTAKAVVLCAGMGTRLGSLTQSTPKALLPIGDEPLLVHTLRTLRVHGYADVAINLHFCADQIREAIGDGARWGVRVRYSLEEHLLGTAGALRRLRDFIDEEVLVVYGDLFLDHDLSALRAQHERTRADATLLLHERPGSNSLVAMDDDRRITGFVERPTEEERARYPFPWTNSGVAIVKGTLVDDLEDGKPADLPRDVYVPRLRDKRLYGHPLAGQRVAIDSPERYEQAKALFSRSRRGSP